MVFSYFNAAQRLSRLIKTKPYKARDVVVDWIEYVAENKGLPELELASAYMSFYQYLGLDICLALYVAGCCVLTLLCFIFLWIPFKISIRCRKIKRE